MTGSISIGILGPLEVALDGNVVNVGTPKERQILLAMLLEPGRRITTDRLVDYLWSDSPPAKPLVSLGSYLSNLRRTLGRSPDGGDYIVTEANGYRLNIGADVVDSDRFESLLAEPDK